ncbi:hypothetical protein IFR04_007380 [Cadophora malorum]|uniref:Uncharacterized protein n=1 Tax=Cadophora malorum TaxID=108018 RepID=A0A8H7THG1_9HELO|nr:hypothetical protein IFR04_007380 [Cadophora malorum]
MEKAYRDAGNGDILAHRRLSVANQAAVEKDVDSVDGRVTLGHHELIDTCDEIAKTRVGSYVLRYRVFESGKQVGNTK